MAKPDPQTLWGGQKHVKWFPVIPIPRLPAFRLRHQHDQRRQPHICPEAAILAGDLLSCPQQAAPGHNWPLFSRWVLSNLLPLPRSLCKLISFIRLLSQLERTWASWTQDHSSFLCPALLLASHGFSSQLWSLGGGKLGFIMLLAGGTLILKIFSPPPLLLGLIALVVLHKKCYYVFCKIRRNRDIAQIRCAIQYELGK